MNTRLTVDCETPVKAVMETMSKGIDELAVTENGARIGRIRHTELMAKLLNPRG